MVAFPGGPPRADVSEAAESWLGLLQPLPPHHILFKKERKKEIGGGWEQGTEEQRGETKVVSGEGNPKWGRASIGVRVRGVP